MKGYQIYVIILALMFIVSVSGCTNQGTDVTSIMNSIPEVQQFIKDHPNAQIKVVYLSASDVTTQIESIKEKCGSQMVIKDYWYATLQEDSISIYAWVDVKTTQILCLYKDGAGRIQITEQPKTVSGTTLNPYKDNNYYFSLSKPDDWGVVAGDYITVKDRKDNGLTNVKIQPIHLSGQYQQLIASDIANYLIGKAKTRYSSFEIEGVRESGDEKVLEITALFTENNIQKKSVLTVFVNSPYAMLSSYETTKEEFTNKEELLRNIVASYKQFTPPEFSQELREAEQQASSPLGNMQEKSLENGVKMLLPDGWTTVVLPGCTGLIAQDSSNSGRSVVFLNGLHQSVDPLDAGVTPESYLTDYMPSDLQSISNVNILKYEDTDMSALTMDGRIDVKAMRASFTNEGIDAMGSFTIGTYQTGFTTAVAYLYAITSLTDEFDSVAPQLISMFNSIDYSDSTIAECKKSLDTAWESAQQVSQAISQSHEQFVQQQQQLYEQRQNSNDVILEKLSDVTLDKDRVYNPKYDEVYEVSPTFYEYYDKHREEFEYSEMRQLTSSEYLTKIPLNGALRIR